MIAPFIYNHQFNYIRNQVRHLQGTKKTVADPKILEAVQMSVHHNIMQKFVELDEEQKQLLGSVASLQTSEQLDSYITTISQYRCSFPELSSKQLQKTFAKVKKLKLPNIAEVDWLQTTYLGWSDIGQNKMYIVYPWQERIVGIEGRITPSQKGVCFLCNRHEQLGLFTAISKQRPANASPDYYKALGNYMCLDSTACNHNITDVTILERFLSEIVSKKE
ncbi:FusB/FusC family EF-G-binding protein [Paenibacillus yanchengensis]|uniref:FusB/FusC family EF-G-binding protein n=1 Tax=Paenibacillus yanchengensis TaxID=2035833 RepID=UPI00362B1D6A